MRSQSINQILQAAFQILTYEKVSQRVVVLDMRAHSSWLDASTRLAW